MSLLVELFKCNLCSHCVGKSYFVKQKSMELLLLENGKFTNTEELFARELMWRINVFKRMEMIVTVK